MMDVIVVNLVREGINKHRARELAEHFIKHMAQPEQEPVAIVIEVNKVGAVALRMSADVTVGTRLYTTPPQRTWVGLTDEERAVIVEANTTDDHGYDIWCDGDGVARVVEAKLKEKNT
jgi:hypothetical protein